MREQGQCTLETREAIHKNVDKATYPFKRSGYKFQYTCMHENGIHFLIRLDGRQASYEVDRGDTNGAWVCFEGCY